MRAGGSSLFAAILVALLAAPAAADPADDAFKRGRDLMKAGRYAAACAEFAQSQQLDPQNGTLFNLGQCYEKNGKLASALAAYREVASKDTNAERRGFAADLVKKLAPRVTKLVVQIAGAPRGLVVQVGERRIRANQAVEIDNGSYDLKVQADGMNNVSADVKIVEEGRTLTVIVPLTPAGTSATAEVTQRSEPTGGGLRSRRKTIGIITLAVGGATLATGSVFGYLAMSKWSDAKALCDGSTCGSETDASRANGLRDQALSRANLANILFVAGGVIAVTGIVLWATAPSEERDLTVSAVPSTDSATLTLSGHF